LIRAYLPRVKKFLTDHRSDNLKMGDPLNHEKAKSNLQQIEDLISLSTRISDKEKSNDGVALHLG
jgi:hypothetical protein